LQKEVAKKAIDIQLEFESVQVEIKSEEKVEWTGVESDKIKVKATRKTRKRQVEDQVVKKEEDFLDGEQPGKNVRKPKNAEIKDDSLPNVEGIDATVEAKPKRRRKTKEEKEAKLMPIAARTLTSRLCIGAHVSAAGGVHNSITNAHFIGGTNMPRQM